MDNLIFLSPIFLYGLGRNVLTDDLKKFHISTLFTHYCGCGNTMLKRIKDKCINLNP